jgi:integrase
MFLRWCALPAINLRTTRQLSRGMLRAYAGSRMATQLNAKKCGRSGARRPATANKELRWLSAVLKELHALELVALSLEDIAAGLKRTKEPIVKRGFSRAAELRAILTRCRRHDAEPYGGDYSGRFLSVVLFILLTGARAAEALGIRWEDVSADDDGCLQITVRSHVSKTLTERTISTAHSPLLAWLIGNYKGRSGSILGGSEAALYNTRHKLIEEYEAPSFDYQKLRCTCGTYLTCAPAIFGDAAPYMSARQLGHSTRIAEKHYVGVVKISHDVRTTEDAMQLVKPVADEGWPGLTPENVPQL